MARLLTGTLILLLLLSWTATALAEVGTAVVFLTLAPGARANGMGQAFVALADDATASFYNPAGLALTCDDQESIPAETESFADSMIGDDPMSVDRPARCPTQLFLMHSPWMPVFNLDDLYLEYFAVTREIPDWGHFGLSANYLHVGDVVERDEQGNEMGMFKVYDLAFNLTYSTRVTHSMAVGGNLKYIRSQLHPDDGVGTGWAVDLGWLYRLGDHHIFRAVPLMNRIPGIKDFSTRSLRLGASLSNWGPDISYRSESTADPLPRLLRVGFAYDLLNRPSIGRFLLSAELNKVMVNWSEDGFDEEIRESKRSVGLEYTYTDDKIWVFLRGGYYYDREAENVPQGPTFGGGLRYSRFQFDFAFIAPPEELGSTYTKMYSLGVTI